MLNGIGVGMFGAPNSSSIMGSVPASQRGAASGMRSTFQNSGTALSIGVLFSLMIGGLAATASLPPVSSLFASVLGENPIGHLLSSAGALDGLSEHARVTVTGRAFFPHLISGPFHHGLVIDFSVAAALSVVAALASLMRGGRTTSGTTSACPRRFARPPLGRRSNAITPRSPTYTSATCSPTIPRAGPA